MAWKYGKKKYSDFTRKINRGFLYNEFQDGALLQRYTPL